MKHYIIMDNIYMISRCYSAPLPPEGGAGNALTTCFLNK
jgi:hypothetical protein